MNWSVGFVGLCKAFTMQDIKYCSVDWCPSTNTSINNAVSYIGTSFNYTEAFGLLRLILLTCTGLQEQYEVYHLLEFLFTAWGFLTANNKRVPFRHSVHPYHTPHSLLLFLKNEKKVHHNTLITLTSIHSRLFLDPVTSNRKYHGC